MAVPTVPVAACSISCGWMNNWPPLLRPSRGRLRRYVMVKSNTEMTVLQKECEAEAAASSSVDPALA